MLENLPDVIGVLREGPLHRELKALLAAPGDAFEVKVDGYVIDLVRATASWSRSRPAASRRCARSSTRCSTATGSGSSTRSRPSGGSSASTRTAWCSRPSASPKKPTAATIFEGLVSFPTLLEHPNLTIEVLLCRGGPRPQARAGARPPLPARPGRAPPDRGPRSASSYAARPTRPALIPAFDEPFTTKELAKAMRVPLPLAQKTAHCLRALERPRAGGHARPRAAARHGSGTHSRVSISQNASPAYSR